MMKPSHMTAFWKKKKKNQLITQARPVFAIFEQGLIQQPEVNKQLNFFHQV